MNLPKFASLLALFAVACTTQVATTPPAPLTLPITCYAADRTVVLYGTVNVDTAIAPAGSTTTAWAAAIAPHTYWTRDCGHCVVGDEGTITTTVGLGLGCKDGQVL